MSLADTTFYLTTIMLLLDILYLMLLLYALYGVIHISKSFSLNLQTKIFYWLITISCALYIIFATLWLDSALRVMHSEHPDTVPIQRLKYFMLDFVYIPDSLYPVIYLALIWQNSLMEYESYSIKHNNWNPSNKTTKRIFLAIIIIYLIMQTIFIIDFNAQNNAIPMIFPIWVIVLVDFTIFFTYLGSRIIIHFKFSGNVYRSSIIEKKSISFSKLTLIFGIAKIGIVTFLLYMLINYVKSYEFTINKENLHKFLDGELDISNFVQVFIVFLGSSAVFTGSMIPFYLSIKPECFRLFLNDSLRQSLIKSTQEQSSNILIKKVAPGETSLKVFKCQRLSNTDFQISGNLDLKSNGFGKLFSGEVNQLNNKLFRLIHLPQLSQFLIEEIYQEITVLDNLQFKYIGKLYGINIENNRVVMVSKFYENGSLHNFSIMKETIRSNTSEKISTDPKSRELELALEIARTLRFLHSQSPPIVHGHLKPQNIMLSKNFHIRLGRSVELLLQIVDIGFKTLKKYAGHVLGYSLKSAYSSPEQLSEKHLVQSEQADIYAFGMTLYQIFHEKSPFEGLALKAINKLVLSEHQRPKISENISIEMSSLIRKCWQQEAQKRPTANQVVEEIELIRAQYEQEIA